MITASLIILAVLSYLGRSLVMLSSVVGMAVALWLTADRPLRAQLFALLLGGVSLSFAAEVVHVAHHVVIQDHPDHGGFWTSAFLVGLINVIAMLPAVAWTWYRRQRDELGESPVGESAPPEDGRRSFGTGDE